MSRVGKITRVRVNPFGDNEVRVDVRSSPQRAWSDIRYQSATKDIWLVPEVGDIVEVTKAGETPIALASRHFPDQSLPQNLSEGDIAIKLNDNVQLRFSKQNDGTYNVNIDCDGELQLTGGSIFVGEDGNRKKVATEDHTHTFDYDGGGKNSSTLTGTTDGPNDVTDTEVE